MVIIVTMLHTELSQLLLPCHSDCSLSLPLSVWDHTSPDGVGTIVYNEVSEVVRATGYNSRRSHLEDENNIQIAFYCVFDTF